jgi:hypothetical protein
MVRRLEEAEANVREALTIAVRGEMRRHEADSHLAASRLYLHWDRRDEARKHLAAAKQIIEDAPTRYPRRFREVESLAQQLSG